MPTLRPHGKIAFLSAVNGKCAILDVGCGNDSPSIIRSVLPDCTYTGIDVVPHKAESDKNGFRYIHSSPKNFTRDIESLEGMFDVVVSSHNIEHCDDRWGTVKAMSLALRKNGNLYMSFPCSESVNFPSRKGTLNYFDDKTHCDSPPDMTALLRILDELGFEILHAQKRYRPFVLRCIGLLLEPMSALFGRVLIGTWEYHGFESIIVARKVL